MRPRRGRRGRAPEVPGRMRGAGSLAAFATSVVVVTILYLARAVLIPIALAILLTFVLEPLVTGLERHRVHRVVAVILVVALVFSAVGTVAWTMASQVTSLAAELPQYRQNLRERVAELRGVRRQGVLGQVTSTAQEMARELRNIQEPPKPGEKPLPVVVQPEPSGLWRLPSLFEWAASAAVVFVLVIFMLLERDDLRDRLLRLGGYARLTTTTRALDEAGRRISRYLLLQGLVNTTFGIGIGSGLAVIGVPYAVLFGFLAGILRFIPYLGPWLGAVLPLTLSLLTGHGWQQPLLVASLFLALELLVAMVLEPILYGHSAGVSQVALLVALAFWTWLWGPVGLALGTPLTVCLVVLGKYVPELEFIAVLLADRPSLTPDLRFYQRLVAGDRDEALAVAHEYRREHGVEALFDRVILPALNHARHDRARRRLARAEHAFVVQASRAVVEAQMRPAEDGQAAAPGSPGIAMEAPAEAAGPGGRPPATGPLVLAAPARDEMDELALRMLRHLLGAGWRVEIASPHLLAGELLALVEARQPAMVCIGAIPSGHTAAHTRYLCKRLRARFPDLQIVVGRWKAGTPPGRAGRDAVLAAGADHFGTSLVETRDQVRVLARLDLTPPRETVGAAPTPA